MNSITIIGTGLAGYNLAKEIRKHDKSIPLTMITADGGESYSKPMLSNALSKGKTAEQLVLSNAEKIASQINAKILTRTYVKSINTEKRIIESDNGEFSFSSLVLAIGASQRRPPISGDATGSVITVNDLDDYRQFQKALEDVNTVAIIGAGLIGCEFANDLLSLNKKVIVIGSSASPLDRLLLPEIGQLLQAKFQEEGIEWRLGVRAESVNLEKELPCRYSLSLSNNTKIGADLVVSATGLMPNTELAANAGVMVNKGILVDRFLETNVDGVYAIGDCIEIHGMVLPYVLPIMNCARALAKTLSGNKTQVTYPAMPVVVKTPAYPIVVAPPDDKAAGKWHLEIDSSGAKALYLNDQQNLEGFILTDKKVSEKQELTKRLPMVLE